MTGRHLQSRFGPLSPAFGSANVSVHGSGGFYKHFPCTNRPAHGLLMISLSYMHCDCLDTGCAKINGQQNLDQLIRLPLLSC